MDGDLIDLGNEQEDSLILGMNFKRLEHISLITMGQMWRPHPVMAHNHQLIGTFCLSHHLI